MPLKPNEAQRNAIDFLKPKLGSHPHLYHIDRGTVNATAYHTFMWIDVHGDGEALFVSKHIADLVEEVSDTVLDYTHVNSRFGQCTLIAPITTTPEWIIRLVSASLLGDSTKIQLHHLGLMGY